MNSSASALKNMRQFSVMKLAFTEHVLTVGVGPHLILAPELNGLVILTGSQQTILNSSYAAVSHRDKLSQPTVTERLRSAIGRRFSIGTGNRQSNLFIGYQ